MNLINKICRTRDLLCAVAQDILSMGGFWVVNGQSKTGELLDEWQIEEQLEPYSQQLLDHICETVRRLSDEKAKE